MNSLMTIVHWIFVISFYIISKITWVGEKVSKFSQKRVSIIQRSKFSFLPHNLLTYPWTDLIDTGAIHLFCSCSIRKRNIKISCCTVKDLVAKRRLSAGSSKLKSSLDLDHVGKIRSSRASGFNHRIHDVIGFEESTSDGVWINSSIQFCHSNRTKLTKNK